MKNGVKFKIEFLDYASKGLKGLSASFSKLINGVEKSCSSTQRLQNICSKLTFPDLNATIEAMGKFGDLLQDAAMPGIDFNTAMADLSSITGIGAKEAARVVNVLASIPQTSKSFNALSRD